MYFDVLVNLYIYDYHLNVKYYQYLLSFDYILQHGPNIPLLIYQTSEISEGPSEIQSASRVWLTTVLDNIFEL